MIMRDSFDFAIGRLWGTLKGGVHLALMSIILFVGYRFIAPAQLWLSVGALHVYDTWEGEPPYISFDRVIKRPFRGAWIATVRIVSDGTNSFACLADGLASYAPDARLPPNLTLDWWTHPTKCNLPPGRYRLDTEWMIIPHDGYPAKTMAVSSNVFEIHALPEAIKALRRQSPARSGSGP